MHHELWFTALLNKLLAGVISPLLTAADVAPHDPAHPIPNYVAMEVFVILLILAGVFVLRSQLSVENPGKFQHIMEVAVEFVRDLAHEIIGHDSQRYVAMLATLGLAVLISNVIGLIPSMQTPTGHIESTLGFAVAAFLFYNYQGFRHHGPTGYLKTFCGPTVSSNFIVTLLMALLMFPVEVVSNVFRLLSLSVRLYANMFVGELLEHVFGSLVPIFVPALVMGLHVFVSFIQAYIFVLLPAVYLSMAVADEH